MKANPNNYDNSSTTLQKQFLNSTTFHVSPELTADSRILRGSAAPAEKRASFPRLNETTRGSSETIDELLDATL